MSTIPLFPLHAVLFPQGRIPLQIFEPRYLDMVKRCVKEGSGFGVVTIRQGHEVVRKDAAAPALREIGTYGTIVDWDALPNGRLSIMVEGARKFRLRNTHQQPDYLLLGEAEFLPEEAPQALPDVYQDLAAVLNELTGHPFVQRLHLTLDIDDTRSVGWHLAQLLPISVPEKYALLVCDPLERLAKLEQLLDKIGDDVAT